MKVLNLFSDTPLPLLRIATWNVQRPTARSYKRLPALAAAIRQVNADIWVLTETHTGLSPGDGYAAVSSSGVDRPQEKGERWVTIWSRSGIVSTISTSDATRSACALIEHEGRSIVVYGTVLPWLGSTWSDVPAAGGQSFAASLATQRSDWVSLRGRYPDAMLCVAGDMNQDLSPRHHYGSALNRRALEHGLASAQLNCITAGSADPVACMTQGRWASIDHICVDTETTSRSRVTVEVWPRTLEPDRSLSDHFGVCAEIEHG